MIEEKQLRYVAHIDILGMTALVQKNFESAWHLLSNLAKVREHANNLGITFTHTGQYIPVAERVSSVMFSDTIVLFTLGDTEADLKLILIATSDLFHKAMFSRVPVRAGITHGQFFFNFEESMYAGLALIDAYQMGESTQWLGISVSKFVYTQAKIASFQTGKSDVVIPYPIPIKPDFLAKTRLMVKTDSLASYAVNWPAIFAHDFKILPPVSIESFYSQFKDSFGPFADLHEKDRKKYQNTIDFINCCLNTGFA